MGLWGYGVTGLWGYGVMGFWVGPDSVGRFDDNHVRVILRLGLGLGLALGLGYA